MAQTEIRVTPELVSQAYAALASGDREQIRRYWAEDLVWLVPGHNPLSGWKFGLDAFLGFMGQVGVLSGDSFRMDALVVLAEGDYTADVTHNVGFRSGYDGRGEVPYTKLDIDVVHVLRWRDGKVVAGKGAIFGDGTTQYDQFWSTVGAPATVAAPAAVPGRSNGRASQAPAPTAPVATAVVGRMYECFAKGDMETLKREVFAADVEWALPGHHPLSGVKRGVDEVLAFFGALMQTGITVDNVSFGTIGDDRVVEQHTGHGTIEGREYVFPTCSVYTVREGKIAAVQVYTADQHGVDEYFWMADRLKPIPDRLAS